MEVNEKRPTEAHDEIVKLRGEKKRLTAELATERGVSREYYRTAGGQYDKNRALQARVEELEAKLYRKDACMKAWKQSSDEHEARVEALECAIRRNPCLVLVAQDVPYRDCFPLGPCEPCHCGKDLIAATEQEGET